MTITLKQKIIGAIVIIGAALILIFQGGLYPSKPSASEIKTTPAQSDKPELVSTNPSPLEKAIIWGDNPIEITFNQPIENIPELKYKLEPSSYDFKVELSTDRKTVRFFPPKPLPIGVDFSLTISGEAKFDGKKTLGRDYVFHFKTIEYKGV